MNTLINRERKKFNLKYSFKPMVIKGLSGYVQVLSVNGVRPCPYKGDKSYIDFMDSVFGLTTEDPTYLRCTMISTDIWILSAHTTQTEKSKLLWIADSRPDWIPTEYIPS